jgi:hypothetical protein
MSIPIAETSKSPLSEASMLENRAGLSEEADYNCESDQDALTANKAPVQKKTSTRKSKPFQPIIMCLALLMLFSMTALPAQLTTSVEIGAAYTDNVFQLSSYDLQRFEAGNPELAFVEASDDVILNARLNGAYEMQYRWWRIEPSLTINSAYYFLNSEKQKSDITAGLKLSRRLGELNLAYGYYPSVYLRDYIDTGGTGLLEEFEYAKNQYKADLKVKPFSKSVASLEYKREELFYNKFFTEFDGNIDTWSLGWQQSLPTFYLDAAYSFKAYDTTSNKVLTTSEDASYESNIYDFGILMKKMPLDSKYPTVFWRPGLKLGYEQRYFQGTDSWHAGRTDILNNTDATLQFYFGSNWNINLDYSHVFRNVDAINKSVSRYKEYSENRYGISARYQF